jgi:hypothetical protein
MNTLTIRRSFAFPEWSYLLGVPASVATVVSLLLGAGTDREAAGAGNPASRGLASLPLAAQGPVSAALGRVLPAYRVVGLSARNPAQGFGVRFSRADVAVLSGGGRVGISLAAFGRGGALQPAAAVAPRVHGNRVTYSRGPLVEWWANGPLGLEQGFDVAAPPPGRGEPVALSLALTGAVAPRLEHGAVLLSMRGRSLVYGSLVVTDARGRAVRSWLAVDGRRVLVRVDDRGAAYPLRIDPVLSQSTKLTPSNAPRLSSFGWSVAASGDTIVIGAPAG